MNVFLLIPFMLSFGCGGDDGPENESPTPEPAVQLIVSPDALQVSGSGDFKTVTVTANARWTVESSADWCTPTPASGHVGSTQIQVLATSNSTEAARTAVLTFAAGKVEKELQVKQDLTKTVSYVPAGYSLVWKEEFNDSRLPDGKPAMPSMNTWNYETGGGGWGNNELQTYVPGLHGTDTCAVVTNGTLKIVAMQKGSQVNSIRLNTNEAWTYGYFEARLKLPTGKGTWPAFWMMPKNFKNWPLDGEIDIMEEVGYRPNWTSSAIHCQAYHHSIQTEKTGEQFIPTAQTDFHIYALEWTEDYIECFVDGKSHFKFLNDKQNNKNTWPFNAPFYLKLNLAWGGNWGGAMGIDPTCLPATYEIDYVRVYQKK